MGLAKSSISGMVTHNRERSPQIGASPARARDLVPDIRHPGPWDLPWKDQPPGCLTWKNQGADVHG